MGYSFIMAQDLAFEKALEFVFAAEGIESDDSSDPGGHTRFGISQKAYPDEDIGAMTRERAAFLYKRDYWTPIHGDLLGAAGLCVFDSAVNQGTRLAVRLLQSALDVEMDGKVGPDTMEALRQADMSDVIHRFTASRIQHYAGTEGWYKYQKGWILRANRAMQASLDQIA